MRSAEWVAWWAGWSACSSGVAVQTASAPVWISSHRPAYTFASQMRIVEKLEKRVSAAHELGQLQKLVEAARYVEDEARD